MTTNINQSEYFRPNMTKDWLISNGFRYNRLFSGEDADVYTYRFSVFKYDCFTVLDFKAILGESTITIDVYDTNTINRYAPFYYQEYGNYDKMLKEIREKINHTITKLGIEKRINNECKGKETK